MPAGRNFPIKPHHFPDVVTACQWIIEAAEAGRNMPDLSRNPNSKLAVIKRCMEELIRNRRQIEYLVVENDVLKKLVLKKDDPCPKTSPARDAVERTRSDPVSPPTADSAAPTSCEPPPA